MNTKLCTTCKQTLPMDSENFRIAKIKKDGSPIYRYECRKCEQNRVNNWRKEKPEAYKAQGASYRKKTKDSVLHIKKRMLKDAKIRAKKKNIEFSIDETHLSITGKCPVLGVDLKCGNGTCTANSPTTDRKDNSKGYIPGNVEVISFKANAIKGNATSEEIFKVALYAEKCEGKGNRFTRWLKNLAIKLL